jgi:hypothetical protein
MTETTKELLIAIRHDPECPACGTWGFDDWHHDPGIKAGVPMGIVALKGRLKCHGCGRFFSITKYTDGECHMTMRKAA